MTSTAFQIEAIPAEALQRIRARGADDLGNPLAGFVDATGGLPLRCCLRDSVAGERVAVIGYAPFPWPGPYAESGPVFVHAQPCGGYQDETEYPEGFRHRSQIFRAYGHERKIVEARIVAGADVEEAIAELLARPEVDFVHSRNVAYGCYMFSIRRAASEGSVRKIVCGAVIRQAGAVAPAGKDHR